MREIKFRVWLTEVEKMMDWNELNDADKDGNIFAMDVLKGEDKYSLPMQYTGLKDKNGKEIYEGDVVAVTDGQAWSVEFSEGRFCVQNHINSTRDLEVDMLCGYSRVNDGGLTEPIAFFTIVPEQEVQCEVVGNIYENKELKELLEANES